MKTANNEPTFPGVGAGAELRTELLDRLRNADYLTFERVVCRLLAAMGYERVELRGRTRFSGRNRDGGADIEAVARTGLSMTKVLVQAKQYRVPVQSKYVDELRGAIARHGGGQGIIVSTAEFSPVAIASAKASSILPVRLIGGGLLVRLLIRYGIGVRPGLRVVLTVDEDVFACSGGNSTT